MCICCGTQHGELETHSARDCATVLRRRAENERRRGTGVAVRPLPKDWAVYKVLGKEAA